MARHGKELHSISTGERIPDWMNMESEDIVAEGIGSVVVREEEDGSWSIVRSVVGAAPDVDKGHASKEVAVRLAQAYNEGSSIAIEERVSRQIRKANIHPGMLAKYGENSVTITGIDGTEVKVMTPEGEEFYVDHSQLSEIQEVQDPGLDMVDAEPVPSESIEGVPGMMVGTEEEEEETEEEMSTGLEELEQHLFEGLQVLEEQEEELEGTEIGPPVVFVEIEPMPGERQAPLNASKAKYAGLLSLLKHGGIPITAIVDVQQVKLSDVLLTHRAGLPFDAYLLQGDPIPVDLEDEQLSRDEVIAALDEHYDISRDLAESLVNRATRGYPTQVAHKRGVQIFAQGEEGFNTDMFGNPVAEPESEITIEQMPGEDIGPPEAGFGIRMEGTTPEGEPMFVLTQDEMQINDTPLPEGEFVQQIVSLLPGIAEDPMKLSEQLQLAVEHGVTPTIAVFRMGNCGKCPADKAKKEKEDKAKKDKKEKEDKAKKAKEEKEDKAKKDKNAMVPVEVVSKVSPAIAEAMAANNIKGIRLARLEEILLNAHREITAQECTKCKKSPCTCSKCKKCGKDPCTCSKEKTAKEAPTCPKCNKKHWPFHKCDGGGGGKDKKDEEADSKDEEAGPDGKTEASTQRTAEDEFATDEFATDEFATDEFAEVIYEGDGTFTVDEQAGLSYEQAVDILQTVAPEDDNRWRLDKHEERGETAPELGEALEPSMTGPASLSDAGEAGSGGAALPGENAVTSGKVRMSFDWGEFFTDVIPQLSNSQFQESFDSTLMAPQEETTISQAEKDIHNEEVLRFAREASRRKLPHPYDISYGIGTVVAVTTTPKIMGDITEYRFAEDHTSIDYLVKVDENSELWYSEEELTPVEGKDKNDKAKKDKKEKEDKAKKAKEDKAKKDKKEKEDKAKKAKEDKAKKDKKKEAAKDLQPTSNPDTTTVPWTARSKGITDPENSKQDSEYKQDLAQKTGQTEDESTLESIAEDIVDVVVPADQFTTWLGDQPREIEHEALKDLAWEAWGEALTSEASRRYPSLIEKDTTFDQNLAYYMNTVLSWKLPRPPNEAMKVGSLAKIKADYEPAIDEVRSLRDDSVAGTVVELKDKEAAVKFENGVLLINKANLEVVSDFFRGAVIRKCKSGDKDSDRPAEEQVWCLYAKSTGKVLGRHSSEKEAQTQEAAIKAQGAVLATELTPEFIADALEDEKQGTQEYADMAEALPEDSPHKQTFEEMSSDEAGHAEHIKKMKDAAKPIGGDSGPKRKKKLTTPQRAPSRRVIEEDKGSIPQGHPDMVAPSQRKYACTIYTFADQLVTKVQKGAITSADAKKRMNAAVKNYGWNAAQKKYIKQRLEGKVASRTESMTRDARSENVPTNLTLCYQPEKSAYCLYDLDFGPISVDNAKEKDIKGQLQAFRLPDAQITEALKEAKQGEVLIRIGMDVTDAISYAIDAVMSGTNTLSGTQLIAPTQAPRGILMKAAMEELSEILGEDVAASYQKPLKKALQDRLEGEPRQEYDGHREFPQHGLTVPAAKTARTYDEAETRERVKQFAEHGIPLDIIKRVPRPQPDEIVDTPPDRSLSAIASLQPFGFGEWVRDKIHPEFTGVVIGYSGDRFIRVAMHDNSYCDAGSESLYLVDGLERVAQGPKFEDTKRKKQLIRNPLQETKQELFWDDPKDRP